MSDYKYLLDAIRAEPGDDLPRGVLADWLVAQGDPRAEYIQMVMERNNLERSNVCSEERVVELRQKIIEIFDKFYCFSDYRDCEEDAKERYRRIFKGTGLCGSAGSRSIFFRRAVAGPESAKPISFQRLRDNLEEAYATFLPFHFVQMTFDMRGSVADRYQIPVKYLPEAIAICEQSAVTDLSLLLANQTQKLAGFSPYIDFFAHSYFSKLQNFSLSCQQEVDLCRVFEQFPKNNLTFFSLENFSPLRLEVAQRIVESSRNLTYSEMLFVTPEAADFLRDTNRKKKRRVFCFMVNNIAGQDLQAGSAGPSPI